MKKKRETFIKYLFVLICLLALTACGQAGSVGKTIPEETFQAETSLEETPPAETLSEETPTEETLGVYVETIDETELQEIVTIVEELEGVRIVQTGPSLPYSDGYDSVRLQITWDRDGQHGEQEIILERIDSPLTTDRNNCKAWDGDDDGYEDILYYTGYTSGSGGSWNIYYLLRWSEEKQEYESIELPWCDYICYEDHKLHSIMIDTPARQYYRIYGLQNGEYQEEKELALLESRSDDDIWVLTVEYSEYGEIVETTDFFSPIPDWKETKSILKEKYPEFIWWWD